MTATRMFDISGRALPKAAGDTSAAAKVSVDPLTMTRFDSPSAEWLPVSIAPPGGDLEVCIMDYDGIVLALGYPVHKNGVDWVDASNKEQIDIQPTHWRKWDERQGSVRQPNYGSTASPE